jgi:hypothetical protein
MKKLPHKPWTIKEIEVLKKLVLVDALSFLEVAKVLGRTKNAIIAICQRREIKHPPHYVANYRPNRTQKQKKKENNFTKQCLHCSNNFLTRITDSKKFCTTQCAVDFHYREKKQMEALKPSFPKKEFLVPHHNALKCKCGNYAVPNHRVCYTHGGFNNHAKSIAC